MRGIIFYDAGLIGNCHRCNICGKHIDDFKAWVYRDGDIILFFCGNTHHCLDVFLELNNSQNVEDEDKE